MSDETIKIGDAMQRSERHHTIFSLILLGVLSGCTSVKSLEAEDDYYNLTSKADGKTVSIWTNEKVLYRGTSLTVHPDSISWFDMRAGGVLDLPTGTLASIEYTSHTHGARDGLVVSVVAGVAGALLSVASNDGFFTSSEAALIGGLGAGLATAVLAVPIGAASGRKYVYRIDQSGHSSQAH